MGRRPWVPIKQGNQEEDFPVLTDKHSVSEIKAEEAASRIPSWASTTHDTFVFPFLDESICVNIVGLSGSLGARMLAPVCRLFSTAVTEARYLGRCNPEVLSICTRGNYTIICTVQGVYACGGLDYDETYHDDTMIEDYPRLANCLTPGLPCPTGSLWRTSSRCLTIPTRVEALNGLNIVSAMTASYYNTPEHQLFLTAEGRVYTLIRPDNDPISEDDHKTAGHAPRLIEALVGKTVIGMSAGFDHDCLWTADGQSFEGGGGGKEAEDWALGRAIPERWGYPLDGKKVVGVVGGCDYSLMWTDEGEIYSQGAAGEAMGHGDETDNGFLKDPKLIEGPLLGKKVVGAAATVDPDTPVCQTLVWTETGELYAFGKGLPCRDFDLEMEPVPILWQGPTVGPLFLKVVGVSTSYMHALVLTDDGRVYSYGDGRKGQLGHGDEVLVEQSHLDDEAPHAINLRRIEGPNKKVVGISAGDERSFVWTDNGEIYSFGNGKCGRLGHGSEEQETLPKRVELCLKHPDQQVRRKKEEMERELGNLHQIDLYKERFHTETWIKNGTITLDKNALLEYLTKDFCFKFRVPIEASVIDQILVKNTEEVGELSPSNAWDWARFQTWFRAVFMQKRAYLQYDGPWDNLNHLHRPVVQGVGYGRSSDSPDLQAVHPGNGICFINLFPEGKLPIIPAGANNPNTGMPYTTEMVNQQIAVLNESESA